MAVVERTITGRPSISFTSVRKYHQFGPHKFVTSACIFHTLGNLHPSTTEGDLIRIFREYGSLLNVDYKWHMVGPNRGRPRGFAFVEFGSEEDAAKAVRSTSDMIVRGRRLTVRLSDRNTSAEGSNIRGSSVDKCAAGSTFINREISSSLGTSLKRGRVEGGALDSNSNSSSNDKKSRTVRSIDEQMRRIRETLSKIESESSK